MTKIFNIATAAVAATAPLHIKSADGEPLYADDKRTVPMRIIVHGPGSKAYGAVESRQSARALKRMQDNDGKITAATQEERVAETAEDLASITIAFEGFEYQPPEGGPALVGADMFRAAYADQGLGFITKQVTKFVGDWGNFKAASNAA
jgi:hypothetical protein